MKETNMEHYRGEIEAIMKDFEGFGVDIDNSKLIACKSGSCERCKFSYMNNENKEDPCAKHKIKWLMSEYNPETVLTEREKHFVEFVQTGYIARDKNGGMWWHEKKPVKNNGEWQCFAYTMAMNSKPYKYGKVFPFITWEDEEPWSVEELRKLKVADEV